jgi:hypothetical protein
VTAVFTILVIFLIMAAIVMLSGSGPVALSLPELLIDDFVAGLGLTLVETREDELVLEGVAEGTPFTVCLDMDGVASGRDVSRRFVSRATITLQVPLPGTFRLSVESTPGARVPRDTAQRLLDDAPREVTELGISALCRFEGDEADARAFLTAGWRDALSDLLTYDAQKETWFEAGVAPWDAIVFDEALTLRWEPRAFKTVSNPKAAGAFVKAWPGLLDSVAECARRSPTHGDVPRLLSARAEEVAAGSAHRWRALRDLIGRDPGGPWAQRFYDGAAPNDALNAVARFWAAREDTDPDDIPRALNTDDEATAAMSARAIGEVFPWEVFTAPGCPPEARGALAEAALAAAPPEEERDDALVALLLGQLAFGANRRELFTLLTSSGWSPGPDARARLARDGVASIRNELIRDLHAREVTRDDAPMLAALLSHGHEGDVAPYVAQLEDTGRFGAGRLSVAEGGASGGLTAADGANGLTLVDGGEG